MNSPVSTVITAVPSDPGVIAPDGGASRESATVPRSTAVLQRRRKVENEVKRAKIMLVDDEDYSVFVIRKFLKDAGYTNVVQVTDAGQTLSMLQSEQPELLLLDLSIHGINSIELLTHIISLPKLERLPVLVLSDLHDADQKQAALEMGALDFLTKPVDALHLITRVRNALVTRNYQDRLSHYAAGLESTIHRRTADLEASRREVVYCLARAAEFRDDITGRHVIRVGKFVGVLAKRLGFSPNDIDLLEMAAQLHDIGKIGIPDDILKKTGKLTEIEYRLMKKHCAMGLHILRPLHDDGTRQQSAAPPTSPLLALAGRIAATHHEKWDGSGYPLGLKGEQIPIEGRLTAIADVFDSLSSVRPYKPAFPLEKCLQIIREGSGQHFDPTIVEHFFSSLDEILALQAVLQDPNA